MGHDCQVQIASGTELLFAALLLMTDATVPW
jgi:hypothetical protein